MQVDTHAGEPAVDCDLSLVDNTCAAMTGPDSWPYHFSACSGRNTASLLGGDLSILLPSTTRSVEAGPVRAFSYIGNQIGEGCPNLDSRERRLLWKDVCFVKAGWEYAWRLFGPAVGLGSC